MRNLEKCLRTPGIALPILFVASMLFLLTSPFGSARRGAAVGAFAAVAWLEMAWFVVAGILAVMRWRALSTAFRIILLCNVAVICVLLADYCLHRA